MGVSDGSAKVIEQLNGWGAPWLVEPTFIEDGMMTCFNETAARINVPYISIYGGEAKNNAGKVMFVQLGSAGIRLLDIYLGTKNT